MKELKVGMRGRVYGYGVIEDLTRHFYLGSEGEKATIILLGVNGNDMITVLSEESDLKIVVHCHQFKPFKPKKKPREFWVNIYQDQSFISELHSSKERADSYATTDRLECIKVREVIKK